MVRTSASDPLRVPRVEAPGGGSVGLTLCPGKKQSSGLTGAWDRDLHADLDLLRDMGSAALLTLMEADELRGVGVRPEDLDRETGARGIEWLHLPIADVQVPDESFERLWLLAGARLRRQLDEGRLVVVHCRGGLGRSGTIAARLLAERGMDPREAVRRVRAVRPGAVETEEQARHAYEIPSPPAPGSLLDRTVGCLVGGAIGDALGAPVEFQSLEEIRRVWGRDGVTGQHPGPDGRALITDDTQMTMFTAEGLIRAFLHERDPAVEVWHAYRRWLRTQQGPLPRRPSGDGWLLEEGDLWARRAPGNTCLSALQTGRMGTIAAPLNTSKGCGGAMRVAPVGLAGPRVGDAEAVFDLGAATAAVTHGHPAGQSSAGFLAAAIAEIVAGADAERALEAAERILARRDEDGGTGAAVHRARRHATTARGVPEEIAVLGEGWTGEEAVAIALFALQAAADPYAALCLAVNHDGDTDSTGAIAGNLVGALGGAAALPPALWRPLELLDPLVRLATDLSLAVEGRLDPRDPDVLHRYPATSV